LEQVVRRPESVRRPGERLAGIARIAVVRDDRLGDLVLTFPAVAALRRAYVDARLSLVVGAGMAELARRVGGVDEVLESERTGTGLSRQLASLRADLVVCVSRGREAAWAAARAGIRHRVGTGRRFYSPLFNLRVETSRRRAERHEVEHALDFAYRVGARPAPATFGLDLADEERRAARDWLVAAGVEAPFVVLHPGSGGSCPSWPLRHFLELGCSLRRSHGVVFSIGPGDREVARMLESARPAPGAPPVFRGTLPELAALLERAALIVASSTGPIHVAAALGRPALALHAPWASCGVARWGPYHPSGWGLVADHAGAVSWSHAERRRRAPALMEAVLPETVLECATAMMAGRFPRVE
jgi:ADP-heptose:LPS heptosyltransferase